MNGDLQVCPGNSLLSFLKTIAYDLKRKQIEYLITAYFDENGCPKAMRQIRGRTSWVTSSINDIIEEAKGINASGVCLVHNHPARAGEKPNLNPSDEDITYQRQFLEACQKNNLSYLGVWIVSKGHFTETLYHTWQIVLKREESPVEQNIYTALTPALKETVELLTKPLMVVSDLYEIGNIAGLRNRGLQIKTRNDHALGHTEISTNQCLLLSIHELVEVSPLERLNTKLISGQELGRYKMIAEFSDILSFEEIARACDSIEDLYKTARQLSGSVVDYKEVNLELSGNSKCGFFQKETNQQAFVTIRDEYILFDINDLLELHHLFKKAIDQLESLSIPQSEKNTSLQAQTELTQNYKVSIKGPDDQKKLYFATKEFCKDIGLNFLKAKEYLIEGAVWRFKDKDEALRIIEKYNQMGCKTEIKKA